MTMPKLLTIEDLATLLRTTPNAIRVSLSRRPDRMPPTVDVGTRKVLFRETDVEAWLSAAPTNRDGVT